MSRKNIFEEFLQEAKLRHPNEGYTYDVNTYTNTHTPTRIICPKHGEFWATPKSHLLYECKACSYEKRGKNFRLSTEEFITRAESVHGKNKYDYSKVEYHTAHIPICIICPKHGEFWQKPNTHLSGRGCPKCNESQLEKKLEQFLKNNNILYISQYKPEWLGKQSLDFYLRGYNIGIECQGKQHFGVGKWTDNGVVIERDKRKFNLCNDNQLELIYLVDKRNKSYIKEDIIYKDKIFIDFNDMLNFIKKEKG